MSLPEFKTEDKSVITLAGSNAEGDELLALIDEAQELFPEWGVFISQHWKSGYRFDGLGVVQVINHLDSTIAGGAADPENGQMLQDERKDLMEKRRAHIEALRKYVERIWPEPAQDELEAAPAV